MKRLFPRTTTAWLICAGLIAIALFSMKYRVIELEAQLNKLNEKIAEEHNAMHVLKAEWSYLNQPEYLEKIAGTHFKLSPVANYQVLDIRDLQRIDIDEKSPTYVPVHQVEKQ